MNNKPSVVKKVSRRRSFCLAVFACLAMFLFAADCHAQSLGDPIVHITFGSGLTQYGKQLPADSGQTDYAWSGGKSPDDGQYAIVNSTRGLNKGWVTTVDHTGDPYGYMMVVNASFNPGIFYTRTVSGLCSGTTYQFGAWIKNILNTNGILPNVSFSIEAPDGTPLLSFGTHDIGADSTWRQYTGTFTTRPGVESVVVKMFNNAPGGTGNDIAIDDITFRPYGSPITVQFDGAVNGTICAQNTSTLTVKAVTPLDQNFAQKLQQYTNGTWTDISASSTSSVFTLNTPTVAGHYSYRLIKGDASNIDFSQCVVASNQLDIDVASSPRVNFILPEICLSDVAHFTDSTFVDAGIGLTYLWDFGDSNATSANNKSTAQNPTHKYTQAKQYNVTLTAFTSDGCQATLTKQFTVNGANPQPDFTVLNPTSLCSNHDVYFTNNSTVDFGNVTRLKWDFGDGSAAQIDEEPRPGKLYHHKFAAFGLPQATKNMVVRLTAYSGADEASCVQFKEKTITLLAAPQDSIMAPDSVCLNFGPVQFAALESTGATGSGTYSGTAITSGGLFDPQQAGVGTFDIKYIFAGTTGGGCADTVVHRIKVTPLATVNLGPDIGLYDYQSATMHPVISGEGLKFKWTPAAGLSNDTIANPVVKVAQDMLYTLTVTNKYGCSVSDQINVISLQGIVVPNTFTPNGDGVNDTWVIKGLAPKDCTVDVFNRNGQKVYTSVGYPVVGWDGRRNGADVPVGVYYYLINPKFGQKVLSGYVTIVR